MNTTINIIEARKKAASLIKGCLYQEILIREALKLWPQNYNDPTLICAKHALIHYETDDDIRNTNTDFAEEQIQWLENIITILSKGEALPKNIIEIYKEYYEIPIPLKTRLAHTIAMYICTLKSLFKK